ncbi:MAG: hypothetical protein ACTSXH_08750 [Promethearchaeota archaeon]
MVLGSFKRPSILKHEKKENILIIAISKLNLEIHFRPFYIEVFDLAGNKSYGISGPEKIASSAHYG